MGGLTQRVANNVVMSVFVKGAWLALPVLSLCKACIVPVKVSSCLGSGLRAVTIESLLLSGCGQLEPKMCTRHLCEVWSVKSKGM